MFKDNRRDKGLFVLRTEFSFYSNMIWRALIKPDQSQGHGSKYTITDIMPQLGF